MLATTLIAIASSLWILTCSLSYCTFEDHRRHLRKPYEQVLCLRVALFPPIVGLVAVTMFLWPHHGPIFMILFKIAAPYTLLCYFVLIVVRAGGETKVVEFLRSTNTMCGILCFSTKAGCATPMTLWKVLIYQFVIVFPLIGVVTAGVHLVGKQSALVPFVSVSTAFTTFQTLLQVTRRLNSLVVGFRSHMKFRSIQIILITVAVQELVIGSLVAGGGIPPSTQFDSEERGTRFNAYILAVESVVWTLLLRISFSCEDYLISNRGKQQGDGKMEGGAVCDDSSPSLPGRQSNPTIAGTTEPAAGDRFYSLSRRTLLYFVIVRFWDVFCSPMESHRLPLPPESARPREECNHGAPPNGKSVPEQGNYGSCSRG